MKNRRTEARATLVELLFWIVRIIAIIWLGMYLWNTYKPPVQLTPNDWDLPVKIEVVK